jgi:GT2 family glycosyltransferase
MTPHERPFTWIVMPAVNSPELTQVALKTCLQQSVRTKVLLILNGGTPEMREACLTLAGTHSDRVRMWAYTPALPLAAVWNRGLEMVWRDGGTEALVVNNDVELHRETLQALLEAQRQTGGWCLTPVNVGEARWRNKEVAGEPVKAHPILPFDSYDLANRGGPDFSCFLLTEPCHRWFQFDERFTPAYHEDNDFHHRLELAGFGDRIFGLPIPYFHQGSATLKADEELRARWNPIFEAGRAYYVQKWGGTPREETRPYPFGICPDPATGVDARAAYCGQGRGELTFAEYTLASDFLRSQTPVETL